MMTSQFLGTLCHDWPLVEGKCVARNIKESGGLHQVINPYP